MGTKVTIKDAAESLGVSSDTIRRWEKKGLIKSTRNSKGYRIFDIQEIDRLKQKYNGENQDENNYRILESNDRSQYKVIELFSGAGGLALGFENAGLNTELLVEIDRDSVNTLKKNRPDWNVIQNDIKNVGFKDFENTIDIVAGGFPCQAFSYAGHGRGFEDARGTLFFEFARTVQEVYPKIALAENVRGLLKHDNGRTLRTILSVMNELGYYMEYRLLRSQFHDVPQKRERLILIGIRMDLIEQMHHLFPIEKDYTISLREAFANVPKSLGQKYSSRKKFIMGHVPEGGNWRDLPDDLKREYMKKSYFLGGGKTGMARRLSWDEPSLTLTCNPGQKQTERCHPEETRPLSVREYARLQTFPDEWEFVGSASSQYKQIGNAVPVNLGYHIGRGLITMLDQDFTETRLKNEGLETQETEKNFQLPLI